MSDLKEVLPQVKARIARHGELRTLGEENTKATLIDPVLRALGWDVENIEEVKREFRRKSADKPVDYGLFVSNAPLLFIEAKALGQNLSDRRWANQIMGYASVAGARWVVLTDGNEYRIYNAHAEVPIEEKLFRTVHITDEESQVQQSLSLLSKERITGHGPEALWKAEFADRQVQAAIEALSSPGSNTSLVRLVKKHAPNLSRTDIRSSLSRVRVRLDFRVEPVFPSSGGARKLPSKAAPGRPKRRSPIGDVSLHDLIQAGLFRPPLELERTYKSHRLTARVEPDGRVTCLGRSYDSLSTSAGMARFSIVGAPPGRKYPQTNGWMFWQFKDESGQLVPVNILRQQSLRSRGKLGRP